MEKARILTYDIETSNLEADFGSMLSFGYKWLGDPKRAAKVISIADTNGICRHCKRVNDPANDKLLLVEAGKIISQADGVVTWYGKGFDERFLRTRYLHHRIPPLPPVNHIDGWFTARYKLKLHSNRLASVQTFLGLPDSKTPVSPDQWQRARNGDLDGLKYVVEHNRLDVIVLEDAYKLLLPYISQHLNFNHFSGGVQVCTHCGSHRLQYDGNYYAPTRGYRKFQCLDCGKWGKDSKAIIKSSKVGLG